MSLNEAAEHFINSKVFKELAKDREMGSHFRIFKMRFEKGELKEGAIIKMLEEHGYSIKVIRPKR